MDDVLNMIILEKVTLTESAVIFASLQSSLGLKLLA